MPVQSLDVHAVCDRCALPIHLCVRIPSNLGVATARSLDLTFSALRDALHLTPPFGGGDFELENLDVVPCDEFEAEIRSMVLCGKCKAATAADPTMHLGPIADAVRARLAERLALGTSEL